MLYLKRFFFQCSNCKY